MSRRIFSRVMFQVISGDYASTKDVGSTLASDCLCLAGYYFSEGECTCNFSFSCLVSFFSFIWLSNRIFFFLFSTFFQKPVRLVLTNQPYQMMILVKFVLPIQTQLISHLLLHLTVFVFQEWSLVMKIAKVEFILILLILSIFCLLKRM